jgi:hypothetical protein
MGTSDFSWPSRRANLESAIRVAALFALAALTGCQTPAERQADRAELALRTCDIQQLASHEYVAMKDNLAPPGGDPSPALQANPKRPTPAEARIIHAFFANYILPCRKFRLEALASYGRDVVDIAIESYREQDAHWIALGDRKISWGEFNRATAATTAESSAWMHAVIARHPILEAATEE